METNTKTITIYTMKYCPYCDSAKRFFKSKDLLFKEIMVDEEDEATWKKLEKQTGYKTMPQIFIGDEFIGGYTQLMEADKSGKLKTLIDY